MQDSSGQLRPDGPSAGPSAAELGPRAGAGVCGNSALPAAAGCNEGAFAHSSPQASLAVPWIETTPATTCSTGADDRLQTAAQPRPVPLAAAPGQLNPRVYEVWAQVGGRSQFFCCGHCVTGPRIDFGYTCCAWSFILLPSLAYFVFCARWLSLHVSPWMPVLTGLTLASTVVLLLLTSCTDPGIIPRHALQVVVRGLEEEVAMATGAGPLAIDTVTSEPVCELTPEESALGYRWCPSCKVVRPPRASHCRDCDNCVLTFDHHCPFVHNCVGQRNYAFFSGFLISTGCLGFAVTTGVGICFYHGGHHGTSLGLSGPLVYVLLGAVGAPTGLLLLGVLGLTAFHGWLACRGRTTREALTGRLAATTGRRTFLAFRGPSLLHARDRVSYAMAVV
mmetsp:Transcript_73316/g.222066  ORF Transcript_73316/g.222066 Transcript_73316/m.222066 type:complete len:392 (-) Transcript_73316:66-1241(-)